MPDFMVSQLSSKTQHFVRSIADLITHKRLRSAPTIKLLTLSVMLPLGVLSTVGNNAYAACKGRDCACVPSELQFQSPTAKPGANGKYPISLEADDVEAQGQELVTLTGNAEVKQGRQTIVADSIKYYRDTDRVLATGSVEMISEKGDYLASDSIDVHAPTQIGSLTNTDFKLAKSLNSEDGIDTVQIAARGFAGSVDLEGEGLLRLENARYTTCPEGDDSVVVSASNLELDQNAGYGTAKGATIRFKGVPIMYAPYMTFPINDQRKTGLLAPSFGSDRESGNILEVPWYWNIAKNQDATITPRYFSDRGLQVGAEYRRKTLRSETYIYGEYLGDDEIYGEDRDLLSVQHFQQFTDRLSGKINYNDVSDVDYFDNFRNQARYFSATYVPRDASLSYKGKHFGLTARANEYQIIDPDVSPDRKPYERLPSVSLRTNLPDGPWGMRYDLSGSYTNFSSDFRTEGKRSSLTGGITLPFETLWGFANPKISLYHRSYSLSNMADGAETSPSFTVPVFSLDTGLYFEKNTTWLGEGALHTLEPRIFYVYAPNEDQDDVPLFDTSQVSLNNMGNIFRENRFYGEDRVGDTNQVTVGVTTRIIDNKSGKQRLKASFGQLYIIDDLEQNLRGSGPIESGLGDFLAELQTSSKGGWTTRSFVQYDHDLSEIRAARFSVAYKPRDDSRKNVSVGYSYRKVNEEVIDQLTLNAHWPISDRWQIYASERYLLEESESLSTTLGLEYSSCCWKFRISGQERLQNRDIEDKKTAVFVELELTGLGSIRSGL